MRSGCTGARISATLLHEMLKRKGCRGLVALCVTGGVGMALEAESNGERFGQTSTTRTPLGSAALRTFVGAKRRGALS